MDRAVILLCAMLVNALFAGPRRFYAPFKLEGLSHMPARLVGQIQRKLDREHRGLREREARGAILVVVVFAGCLFSGWVLGWLFSFNLQFMQIVFMACLLPVRPTWGRVKALHRYVQADNLQAARQALEHTTWRHSALLDSFGLCRAGIEYLAVQFSAKILAPSLWFCLCGLPGFLFARALYMVVETLNMPEGEERGFGRLARQVHRVVDYIPSRFSALLWICASYFLAGAEPKVAAKAIWRDMPSVHDSQTFLLMSVSHVLQVSLGGPMSAYGDKRWWGHGTLRTQAPDVAKALYLFVLLHIFLFIAFGLFF